MRGVEAIEPQARRGDLIEHRRLHVRVAVVAGLLPAVVVAHQQDDVRPRLGGELGDHTAVSYDATSVSKNFMAEVP